MYGMNRYIGCGGDDSRGCVGRGEVCDVCQDFLPVGKNPPPPSLLGDFGREFGVRAPGFDGAAKLRKNADRATLLHITIFYSLSMSTLSFRCGRLLNNSSIVVMITTKD
jgi:hypothetical protein